MGIFIREVIRWYAADHPRTPYFERQRQEWNEQKPFMFHGVFAVTRPRPADGFCKANTVCSSRFLRFYVDVAAAEKFHCTAKKSSQ
jgi:hypothetical protein